VQPRPAPCVPVGVILPKRFRAAITHRRTCALACVVFAAAPLGILPRAGIGCGRSTFVAIRSPIGVCVVPSDAEQFEGLLDSIESGSLAGEVIDCPTNTHFGILWERHRHWIRSISTGVFSLAEEAQARSMVAAQLVSMGRIAPGDTAALLGGGIDRLRPTPDGYITGAAWLLATIVVGINLFTMSERQRERRAAARLAAGQCPGCGYSLGGLMEAFCPECGASTAFPAAPRPPAG
jgi:hypothetical protein